MVVRGESGAWDWQELPQAPSVVVGYFVERVAILEVLLCFLALEALRCLSQHLIIYFQILHYLKMRNSEREKNMASLNNLQHIIF